MEKAITLRGFATISFFAADHDAAKQWYADLLGIEPYFNMPGYSEFRIGDFQHEFGLIDAKYAHPDAAKVPGGAIMYWHVDDIKSNFELLLAKGATTYEPITERSGGFVTASVTDPFGNILGIMYNPHYLEMLEAKKKA